LADFISAEWEAKGRAFEIALQSPFPIPIVSSAPQSQVVVTAIQEDLWRTPGDFTPIVP